MESRSQHYHRMVGLNADWSVSDVNLDVLEKTLRLTVEYVGQGVVCPDRGISCAMKDYGLLPKSWSMWYESLSPHVEARGLSNEQATYAS
jgi:hypothetical protein